MKRNSSVSKEERDRIALLSKQGKSRGQIGLILKLNRSTVAYHVIAMSASVAATSTRRGFSPEEDLFIQNEAAEGRSVSEIGPMCERFGGPRRRSTVFNRLRRLTNQAEPVNRADKDASAQGERA